MKQQTVTVINPETINLCLQYVHDLFEEQNIWHAVIYGTLLGAVRDQDIIPWDHDFDLIVSSDQMFSILALNEQVRNDGFSFIPTHVPVSHLAIADSKAHSFWNSAIGVFFRGEKIGDLYIFFPFNDGVLRRFDFETNTYWCPHSSIPAWFIEELPLVTIRGQKYPGLRNPEKFLEGVYGSDWETPYKAMMQGGEAKENTTTHGDCYLPKLRGEWQWCVDQGWDFKAYKSCPVWPRQINGAGPKGPTDRTVENSGALWWRDIDELLQNF